MHATSTSGGVDSRPPLAEKTEPFVLPIESLHGVAEGAGLQWVTSDAEKVRAAREAMAREAQVAPVVRAPRPVVVQDDGPLILVETKKDLAQVQFPFDAR